MQQLATRSPSLKPDPSGALRTVPATSLPGTNGRSGLIWYCPRVCSTSGKDTPAACTSISTPLPGVSGCEASGSGRSASFRADSGPLRSTIWRARMARERTSGGRSCARTLRVLAIRAAPQMHHRVRAERPPALGIGIAAERLERAPDGDVAGRESVPVTERAHGDVRHGPRADPGDGEKPRSGLRRVPGRIQPEL